MFQQEKGSMSTLQFVLFSSNSFNRHPKASLLIVLFDIVAYACVLLGTIFLRTAVYYMATVIISGGANLFRICRIFGLIF